MFAVKRGLVSSLNIHMSIAVLACTNKCYRQLPWLILFNIVCHDRDDLQLTIELEVTSGQLIIQLKVTRKEVYRQCTFWKYSKGISTHISFPKWKWHGLFFFHLANVIVSGWVNPQKANQGSASQIQLEHIYYETVTLHNYI